jgi:hypothetical protein
VRNHSRPSPHGPTLRRIPHVPASLLHDGHPKRSPGPAQRTAAIQRRSSRWHRIGLSSLQTLNDPPVPIPDAHMATSHDVYETTPSHPPNTALMPQCSGHPCLYLAFFLNVLDTCIIILFLPRWPLSLLNVGHGYELSRVGASWSFFFSSSSFGRNRWLYGRLCARPFSYYYDCFALRLYLCFRSCYHATLLGGFKTKSAFVWHVGISMGFFFFCFPLVGCEASACCAACLMGELAWMSLIRVGGLVD